MDLDVLTRLTTRRRDLARPMDARLAGVHLVAVGANRIDPPGRQRVERRDPERHILTVVVQGRALLQEPGPPRLCEPGQVLVLPARVAHAYASTDDRGWRALWVVLAAPDPREVGLRAGVLAPSAAALCALAELGALAEAGRCAGRRLAAALAVALAELAEPPRAGRTARAVEQALARIRRDPQGAGDLRGIAAAHGISWSSLRQALRARTGLAPARLLRRARLALGAERLAAGAPVGEAARAAGFDDPFHFSRCFREAYGMPPRSWREQSGS